MSLLLLLALHVLCANKTHFSAPGENGCSSTEPSWVPRKLSLVPIMCGFCVSEPGISCQLVVPLGREPHVYMS